MGGKLPCSINYQLTNSMSLQCWARDQLARSSRKTFRTPTKRYLNFVGLGFSLGRPAQSSSKLRHSGFRGFQWCGRELFGRHQRNRWLPIIRCRTTVGKKQFRHWPEFPANLQLFKKAETEDGTPQTWLMEGSRRKKGFFRAPDVSWGRDPLWTMGLASSIFGLYSTSAVGYEASLGRRNSASMASRAPATSVRMGSDWRMERPTGSAYSLQQDGPAVSRSLFQRQAQGKTELFRLVGQGTNKKVHKQLGTLHQRLDWKKAERIGKTRACILQPCKRGAWRQPFVVVCPNPTSVAGCVGLFWIKVAWGWSRDPRFPDPVFSPGLDFSLFKTSKLLRALFKFASSVRNSSTFASPELPLPRGGFLAWHGKRAFGYPGGSDKLHQPELWRGSGQS